MKTQKSEKIFVKRINNFNKKIIELKFNSPSLYSTAQKTNDNNTFLSLSPKNYNYIYYNTIRDKFDSIENNSIINKKLDLFMNKKSKINKKKKKEKEKDVQIFYFLKSTNHTNIKKKKNKLKIDNIKTRFTDSKLEPLNTIYRRIKKKIDQSLLKHHLSEFNTLSPKRDNINIKGYNSDRNEKEETIEDILNNRNLLYDKDNYNLIKIHPHYSKRTQIGSFTHHLSLPSILKDDSLMVRLYKQNFNYQKSSIKDRYKDKVGIMEYI
jgi:hypothetical protein